MKKWNQEKIIKDLIKFIIMELNRFKQLLESQMGNVRPLIFETEETSDQGLFDKKKLLSKHGWESVKENNVPMFINMKERSAGGDKVYKIEMENDKLGDTLMIRDYTKNEDLECSSWYYDKNEKIGVKYSGCSKLSK